MCAALHTTLVLLRRRVVRSLPLDPSRILGLVLREDEEGVRLGGAVGVGVSHQLLHTSRQDENLASGGLNMSVPVFQETLWS